MDTDPLGELRIRRLDVGGDDAFDRPSVVRQVVAADDVDRAGARRPTRGEAGGEHADRARRRLGMREIVRDVRMLEIEPSGRRVVAIAFLGDRERDDPDPRIGEAREHAIALVAEEQQLAHRADDAKRATRRAALEHRVEAVLRRERGDRPRRLEAHAADAPLRVPVQDRVRVDRLVGAMKGTEPEMDDADPDGADVVVGPRTSGGTPGSVDNDRRPAHAASIGGRVWSHRPVGRLRNREPTRPAGLGLPVSLMRPPADVP